MQLSLIAWIENNETVETVEQLSLLDWIEAEEIAKLVEQKLFQRETKQCFTCLEVFPIDSLYCDEMGWPICEACQ